MSLVVYITCYNAFYSFKTMFKFVNNNCNVRYCCSVLSSGLTGTLSPFEFQIVETVYLLPAWNENGWPGRYISRWVNVDWLFGFRDCWRMVRVHSFSNLIKDSLAVVRRKPLNFELFIGAGQMTPVWRCASNINLRRDRICHRRTGWLSTVWKVRRL